MLALELVLPVVKEVLILRARRAGPERQQWGRNITRAEKRKISPVDFILFLVSNSVRSTQTTSVTFMVLDGLLDTFSSHSQIYT